MLNCTNDIANEYPHNALDQLQPDAAGNLTCSMAELKLQTEKVLSVSLTGRQSIVPTDVCEMQTLCKK